MIKVEKTNEQVELALEVIRKHRYDMKEQDCLVVATRVSPRSKVFYGFRFCKKSECLIDSIIKNSDGSISKVVAIVK